MAEKVDKRQFNKGFQKARDYVSYEPHKNELTRFISLATCKHGILNLSEFISSDDEGDVYAIEFGENIYVGSSKNVKDRIYEHYRKLKSGKHEVSEMQSLYDKSQCFNAYVIFRCNERMRTIAERMIILLLRPSLNKTLPSTTTDSFNDVLWNGDITIKTE